MKAHIVGGGFGGLAAAGYLIRHADVPGADITIYEASDTLGGGFFLGGGPAGGYNLPGSVFDSEFRCANELLKDIPSLADPAVSVKDEFFDFNRDHPFFDRAHILDRNGAVVHGPRLGLTLSDFWALGRLSFASEASLDGRRIQEFFSPRFFATEFWLLFSSIMGSLPQHSATEFRRYINRTLRLLPYLSDMARIWRTPRNQYETFIEPLAEWLKLKGVNVLTGAYVTDLGFASAPGFTVNRLDYERGKGGGASVEIAADDIVLVTTGSQVADMNPGSTGAPSRSPGGGRSWALWKRLAKGRKEFGRPEVFFDAAEAPDRRWVGFTVTTTGTEFIDLMTKLTGSEPGTGGLVTLKDFGLDAVVLDLPPARDPPPAARHVRLVGLRPVSGASRRFRAKAHGGLHRRRDPRGGGASAAVRDLSSADPELVVLRPLRHALCQQHLDAAPQRRPAAGGSGRSDQPRPDRPVCRDRAGRDLHHRIFGPHRVGGRPDPDQARTQAAVGLSGPGRSEGAVWSAEVVFEPELTGERP